LGKSKLIIKHSLEGPDRWGFKQHVDVCPEGLGKSRKYLKILRVRADIQIRHSKIPVRRQGEAIYKLNLNSKDE
jgi:hypothetical protein